MKKKIFWIISNSAGELDYFLPFINEIKIKKKNFTFDTIFISDFVYEQFLKDKFYSEFFQHHNIKFTRIKTFSECRNNFIRRFLYLMSFLSYFPLFMFKYYTSNAIVTEKSSQTFISKVLAFLNRIFRKKIFLISTGQQIYIKNIPMFKNIIPNVYGLCSIREEEKHFKDAKISNLIYTGHPINSKYWKRHLEKYINKKKIVIVTQAPAKNMYNHEEFIQLLESLVFLIRKDFSQEIEIKLHPRQLEDINLIKTLSSQIKLQKVNFTGESLFSLSQNCQLCIGFSTSGIWIPVSQGVPTINYEVQTDIDINYPFEYAGIKSIKNLSDLEDIIKNFRNDNQSLKNSYFEKVPAFNINSFCENIK